MGGIAAVVLCFLVVISSVHSFYLPGVAPRDFLRIMYRKISPLDSKNNRKLSTKTMNQGINRGGFGSYLLGLNKKTYLEAGVNTKGNSPQSYKDPRLDWMIGFLFVVSFVGLLSLVPLRKILVIDYKLPYPSGTANVVLIYGFHTAKGNNIAKIQVCGFMKFSSLSFIWSFFQWFYTGGKQCGFINFPTFGLKAWKQTF